MKIFTCAYIGSYFDLHVGFYSLQKRHARLQCDMYRAFGIRLRGKYRNSNLFLLKGVFAAGTVPKQ